MRYLLGSRSSNPTSLPSPRDFRGCPLSARPNAPPRPIAGRGATKRELPEHFKGYKHVWVFVEQERGQAHPVSWELLGAGRKLADKLKVELAAVMLGPAGGVTR